MRRLISSRHIRRPNDGNVSVISAKPRAVITGPTDARLPLTTLRKQWICRHTNINLHTRVHSTLLCRVWTQNCLTVCVVLKMIYQCYQSFRKIVMSMGDYGFQYWIHSHQNITQFSPTNWTVDQSKSNTAREPLNSGCILPKDIRHIRCWRSDK